MACKYFRSKSIEYLDRLKLTFKSVGYQKINATL